MKHLLYLASGSYKPEYAGLPFKSMFFVDASRSYTISYSTSPDQIQFIAEDALRAIDVLKKKCITIDYLVVINEGLYGGGGYYPMFSDFLMGYLSPILKDEFILITDLDYYRVTEYVVLTKLDWAVRVTQEIFPGHPQYIPPSLFSRFCDTSRADFGQVFCMKKIKRHISLSLLQSKIKVSITHGSVWDDEHDLDFIGLNLRKDVPLCGRTIRNIRTSSEFFLVKPQVHNIYGLSLGEIIQRAEREGSIQIGIVPWGDSDYSTILTFLSQLETSHIKEIRFYHLNAKDFSAIYESYAQLLMNTYPDFFKTILGSQHLRSHFYKVIKKGCSEIILKLCELIKLYIVEAKIKFQFSEIKWMTDNTLRISSYSPNQYIKGLLRMSEEMGHLQYTLGEK